VSLGASVEQRIAGFVEDSARRLELPADAAQWQAQAAALRVRCSELLLRGHPAGVLEERPEVVWGDTLQPAPEYRIRKLRFEGYPGVWVPALWYEPVAATGRAPVPAVLNSNGHHAGGVAMDYKQARCINLAKRGMLALSFEFLGMGETASLAAHNQQLLLDLLGQCGAGVFLVVMKRALDLLLDHPATDPERVAMTGLSGGGWQTVLLSALDERVRVMVPVAGHMPAWARRDPGDVGDAEQLPADLCTVADYDTLSALLAPRPTLFIFNRYDDCCFQPHKSVAGTYRPARAAFTLLGAADDCALHVCEEPAHNYGADNRSQLYQWLNRHFGLHTPATDLPWEQEVLSEAELTVGLPPARPSFATMAAARLEQLRRREAAVPRVPDRAAVARVLRYRESAVSAVTVLTSRTWYGAVLAEELLLELDRRWPLPAVLVRPEAPAGATLLVGDGGRPAPSELTSLAAELGHTVLAADLLGCGALRPEPRSSLLLNTVGRPLLGMQVAQLLALARWLRRYAGDRPLHLQAGGHAPGVAALLAAAHTPAAFATVAAPGLPRSLDALVELPVAFDSADTALFCFGLRATLDLDDLPGLAAGVTVRAPHRGPLAATGAAHG
jgi:dienelactone hydrolase